MTIDTRLRTSPKPSAGRLKQERPYVQVENHLRARIQDGSWTPGVMIPSRKDLALEYGVALTVIERAVAGLLADGTLRALDRRGTFVSSDLVGGSPKARADIASTAGGPTGTVAATVNANCFDRTANIGILSTLNPKDDSSGLADPWRGIILSSLERTVSKAGGHSTFYNLYREDGTVIPLEDGIAALSAKNVDAIAIIREEGTKRIAQAVRLSEAKHIPLIFVVSGLTPPSFFAVHQDDRDGGFQAAHHLLQRQHTELAFFSPFNAPWVRDRIVGIQNALEFAGLPSAALTVLVRDVEIGQFKGESQELLGYTFAKGILTEGLPATGIIAANDHAAHGFLKAAAEIGLVTGQDFALVGFDDLPLSRSLGLTTLHPPLESLGHEAGRILVRAFNGDRTTVQIRVPPVLVARASSQPLQNLRTLSR